jgi:hypothetical protein
MKEVTVKVGDVPYRLTSLNARQLQEFLDFARKAMPDPVAEVFEVANQLPEGKVKDDFLARHLDAAFERKRLRGTLTDPDLEAFQHSLPGAKKAASLMFRKYHPELPEDEAFDLVLKMGEDPAAEQALAALRGEAVKVPLSEEDAEQRSFRDSRAIRRKKARRQLP